jgi:hypothetical protein
MGKRFGVELKVTRILLQVGSMCSWLRRYADAEQILDAVKAYRDDLPHPSSLLALNDLCQGRLREAQDRLETILAAYPNHQFGKALLGLVYRDRGLAGWQQLPTEVIEDGRDESAMKLARVTLGGEEPGSPASAGADRTYDPVPRVQRIYG